MTNVLDLLSLKCNHLARRQHQNARLNVFYRDAFSVDYSFRP